MCTERIPAALNSCDENWNADLLNLHAFWKSALKYTHSSSKAGAVKIIQTALKRIAILKLRYLIPVGNLIRAAPKAGIFPSDGLRSLC